MGTVRSADVMYSDMNKRSGICRIFCFTPELRLQLLKASTTEATIESYTLTPTVPSLITPSFLSPERMVQNYGRNKIPTELLFQTSGESHSKVSILVRR
jgi:hypothetical protein